MSRATSTKRAIATASPPLVSPTVCTATTELSGRWWEHVEIHLVGDRSIGATHGFYQNWRIEVVAGPEQREPGCCLFAVPVPQQEMIDSGWSHTILRLSGRPTRSSDRGTFFSWTPNRRSPTKPSPFVEATVRAETWLRQAVVAAERSPA